MSAIGEQLKQLCQHAREELLLVAPFIKVNTLSTLLAEVAPSVQVTCVTRWRLEEILAGVSDIEVWPLLKKRPNSQLYLRSDLHAKYYRADQQVLVGSANLTNAALGWSNRPNFELLINNLHEKPFEHLLFNNAFLVDDGLYQHIYQAVLSGYSQDNHTDELISETLNETNELFETPRLRHPESLYVAYSKGLNQLSVSSTLAVQNDLALLQIPLGLEKHAFESYVAFQLLQLPLIREIDNFLIVPRRFGAVTKFLEGYVQGNSTFIWQTIMRWLLYFLPERYEVNVYSYSEVIYRASEQQ